MVSMNHNDSEIRRKATYYATFIVVVSGKLEVNIEKENSTRSRESINKVTSCRTLNELGCNLNSEFILSWII